MATTTIELTRDDAGHVTLTPVQAAAVARWYLDDDAFGEVLPGIGDDVAACDALARYVLRTTPVVGAAVQHVEDEDMYTHAALVDAVSAAGLGVPS